MKKVTYNTKKCVLFCPTDTWGGVEKNVALRARFLTEKDYEVYVIILKGMFEEHFRKIPNVKIISVNSRGSDINVFVILNYVKILWKIKPFSVFACLKKDWFLVSLSAKIARVPRVILYLGIPRIIKNNIKYRFVFNKLKSIVLVNSDSLKNHLLKTTPFFNSENLFRIYNGFSPQRLNDDKIKIKEKFNLEKDSIIIGCAGRVSDLKGFDLLPKIIKNLPENVHVVIAGGNGNNEKQIKKEIRESKQSNRIHFLGHVNNIHSFFRSIDVFLLCSRKEGMANVLNEALSHGLPSVSTKVFGSEELLDHGKYGILTEIENVKEISEALHKIISKDIIFDSNSLKKWIQESFSMQLMQDRTEQLFFKDLKKV